jgi:calcineurin-like phosphoesterase family protein
MCHSTENLYNYFETPLTRASDDFYPKDIPAQFVHIVSCAFNSAYLGEIATTDWDMFHSKHPYASIHAAARAISGGPVYVSDIPGNHDPVWSGHKQSPWRAEYESRFIIMPEWIQNSEYTHNGETTIFDVCHFPFAGDSGGKEDRYLEHRPIDSGQWLVHGHTHSTERIVDRMIHVGVDAWNYHPVSLDTIRGLINDNG